MVSSSALSGAEVFIERKNYMDAFRKWIESEANYSVFVDTESIYGTGKTTILRKLFSEYEGRSGWIALWLELDVYSLYSHQNILEEWEKGRAVYKAYIQNFYDYRTLLENLAHKLARYRAGQFEEMERQIKNRLEEISDKKFIGALKEQGVDISIKATATTGGIQVGEKYTDETVNKDSWLDMPRIIIENSQFSTGETTVNIDKLNIEDAERINRLITSIVTDAAWAFTEAFRDMYNALNCPDRLVIFGDDFCQLYGHPIGDWFLDLVSGLENTVPVLSRTITGSLPDRVANRAKRLDLDNFTEDETREYLQKKLIVDDLPDELVKQIYHFSAGNPLAVGLAAQLIADADLKDESVTRPLLRIFKQMPPATLEEISKSDKHLAARLNILLAHVRDSHRFSRLLVSMIDMCSVLREFDAQMLKELLTRWGKLDNIDAEDFRRAVDQLRKFPFVENIISSSGVQRYRFHNFVRDLLSRKLEEDEDLFGELHQVAQAYYSDKLQEHQDAHEDDSTYERLYRFEDKLWQGYISEWLYHTSMLRDPQAFRLAEIRLATLYFETFQWWGWFLNSELCDRLLSQWEWTLQSKRTQHTEGEKLGMLLRRFHESYPVNSPGFVKPAGPHWLKVRTALQPMLIAMKLDRKDLSKEEAHLRALILEYIAHSYLYFGDRRQDVEKAEELYYEVRDLHGDDWNISWMTSYLGEIYLRKGEYDKALAALTEASELAEEDTIASQDNEIISRNFCLIGDCYWEMGDYEQAFANYNKAVFFAYAFLWYPDAPDPYCVKWYYAMRFRAAEQLIALHHGKGLPAEARRFAQCLHDFWSLNWDYYYPGGHDLSALDTNLAEGSIQGLLADLFPQPPKPEELDESGADENMSAAMSETLLVAQTLIAGMYVDVASLTWDCGA